MGSVGSLPQPDLDLGNTLSQTFEILKPDETQGFKKGEKVKPVSYFVSHGISSQWPNFMRLELEDGRSLLVQLGSSPLEEQVYFKAKNYPFMPAMDYGSKKYKVTLIPTKGVLRLVSDTKRTRNKK